ncbi:MAG TPA: hypothetical protein VNN80_34240 [Polyangiaceae bacterium]|nr:hypothetical protein [Polyangiaceae bacterium]
MQAMPIERSAPRDEMKKYGAPAPVALVERVPLAIWTNGNIFHVLNAYYTPNPGGEGRFGFLIHNRSGAWITVNIDRSEGVFDTGHIGANETRWLEEATQLYVDRDNKVTRWAPGLFGLPGNGGGEIHFDVALGSFDVFLEIHVVA